MVRAGIVALLPTVGVFLRRQGGCCRRDEGADADIEGVASDSEVSAPITGVLHRHWWALPPTKGVLPPTMRVLPPIMRVFARTVRRLAPTVRAFAADNEGVAADHEGLRRQ
jgi:hypothetical protein